MGATDNIFWPRIQQGRKEAEMLMNQKQYNMAMIKIRQTLENMVNCLGEKALIIEGDLADSIDQLYEGHFISQITKDHYHRIRVLGNKAVHDGNDSPYDANEAFRLLSQEIQTFSNAFGERKPRPTDVHAVPLTSGRNNSQRPDVSETGLHSGAYSRAGEASGTYRTGAQHAGTSRTYQQHSVSGSGTAGAYQQHSASGSGAAGAYQQHSASTPGASRARQQHSASGSGAARTYQQRPGTARPGQRPPQRTVSRNGQRVSAQSRSHRRTKKRGFDIYDLIKPGLIFLILLIVILAVVKLIPGKSDKRKTTAEIPTQVSTEAMKPTEAPVTEPETETEPPKVYTTRSKLNVRSGPSTTSSKLGSLASGTVVEYVNTYDDKWTIIMFEGTEAYVATEFLNITEGEADSSSEAGESRPAESPATAAQ